MNKATCPKCNSTKFTRERKTIETIEIDTKNNYIEPVVIEYIDEEEATYCQKCKTELLEGEY